MRACPNCGKSDFVNLYTYQAEEALRRGFKAEPYAYWCRNCDAHFDDNGLVEQDTRSGEPERPQPKKDS